MTILTDDLIEKAARAINALVCADAIEQGCTADGIWDSLHEPVKAELLEEARAALEAALPSLVERCAKEAEGVPSYGSDDFTQGVDTGRMNAAESIRSLLNKEDENGG